MGHMFTVCEQNIQNGGDLSEWSSVLLFIIKQQMTVTLNDWRWYFHCQPNLPYQQGMTLKYLMQFMITKKESYE